MGLFLNSQFYSVDFYFCSYVCAHCLDYHGFVVCFEIGECESSNFILLFQDGFDCSGSLALPQNFRIRLSVSAVDEYSVQSVDQFGEYCHLNNLEFSDHEHGMPFYLFMSSLISFSDVL